MAGDALGVAVFSGGDCCSARLDPGVCCVDSPYIRRSFSGCSSGVQRQRQDPREVVDLESYADEPPPPRTLPPPSSLGDVDEGGRSRWSSRRPGFVGQHVHGKRRDRAGVGSRPYEHSSARSSEETTACGELRRGGLAGEHGIHGAEDWPEGNPPAIRSLLCRLPSCLHHQSARRRRC